MTTVPEIRTAVEAHLAEQLGTFAREFVAELEAQGRLVEVGGAGVLERLRTQVETWQNCPEAYHAAVDTIVEDCGYPSEVAMRIATALNRKGLIPGGDDSDPRHDGAPESAPDRAEPASRRVVPEPRHDYGPASVPDLTDPVFGGEVLEPRHDHGPRPCPAQRSRPAATPSRSTSVPPRPRRSYRPRAVRSCCTSPTAAPDG